MLLSVVIPAYNEEQNIPHCLDEVRKVVRREQRIPYEVIVVNDNSTDNTDTSSNEMAADPAIRLVNRMPPGGFGRAIRSGLSVVRGDDIVVYMADSRTILKTS